MYPYNEQNLQELNYSATAAVLVQVYTCSGCKCTTRPQVSVPLGLTLYSCTTVLRYIHTAVYGSI